MTLLYNRWITSLMAIIASIFMISIAVFNIGNNFELSVMLVVLSLPMIYNAIIETYVALVFISPGQRKNSIDDLEWKQNRLQHDGPEIFFVSKFHDKQAPLIVMIHGWRSCSNSMLGRAELYLEKGYHIIIMELPGHGSAEGVSKWNAGVATRNLIHLFENLDTVIDSSLVSKIIFHGHSMGGFVFLKFSGESTNINNHEIVKGYILESPLTCYSEIFLESCKRLFVPKFLLVPFWNRMKFHINSINPRFKRIQEIGDVDVPIWGLPGEKTLVIQSGSDERLGQKHYRRLVDSFIESGSSNLLTKIVLDDLTHTGAGQNKNRDNAISEWLDNL